MILCGGSDSGEYKSLEHDFKYLYWTISKMLSSNLFSCEGTYTTDWVGRLYSHMFVYSHPPPCHAFTFSHHPPGCPYCSPQKLKEDSDRFFQKLQGSPIWRGRKGDTKAHVYLDTPDLPFEKYEGRIPQKSVRKAFYIAGFVAS